MINMNNLKLKTMFITSIIISLLLSFLSFAGEFKIIDEKLYYNTGTQDELPEGWVWIVATDNEVYKYFVHENYILTDMPTLDGNKIDKNGRLIENGVLATKSDISDIIYKETNWDNFYGSYHVNIFVKADKTYQNFGQFEWPVKVAETDKGISIAWNGIYKGNEIFTKSDSHYSLESKSGIFIDVIDENYFRIIYDNGDEALVVRN